MYTNHLFVYHLSLILYELQIWEKDVKQFHHYMKTWLAGTLHNKNIFIKGKNYCIISSEVAVFLDLFKDLDAFAIQLIFLCYKDISPEWNRE